MGSIPIARSINPDDSVDLTRLSSLNSLKTRPVLDGGWTVLDSIGRSVFTGVFAIGANRQRAFGWWNGTNTGLHCVPLFIPDDMTIDSQRDPRVAVPQLQLYDSGIAP